MWKRISQRAREKGRCLLLDSLHLWFTAANPTVMYLSKAMVDKIRHNTHKLIIEHSVNGQFEFSLAGCTATCGAHGVFSPSVQFIAHNSTLSRWRWCVRNDVLRCEMFDVLWLFVCTVSVYLERCFCSLVIKRESQTMMIGPFLVLRKKWPKLHQHFTKNGHLGELWIKSAVKSSIDISKDPICFERLSWSTFQFYTESPVNTFPVVFDFFDARWLLSSTNYVAEKVRKLFP